MNQTFIEENNDVINNQFKNSENIQIKNTEENLNDNNLNSNVFYKINNLINIPTKSEIQICFNNVLFNSKMETKKEKIINNINELVSISLFLNKNKDNSKDINILKKIITNDIEEQHIYNRFTNFSKLLSEYLYSSSKFFNNYARNINESYKDLIIQNMATPTSIMISDIYIEFIKRPFENEQVEDKKDIQLEELLTKINCLKEQVIILTKYLDDLNTQISKTEEFVLEKDLEYEKRLSSLKEKRNKIIDRITTIIAKSSIIYTKIVNNKNINKREIISINELFEVKNNVISLNPDKKIISVMEKIVEKIYSEPLTANVAPIINEIIKSKIKQINRIINSKFIIEELSILFKTFIYLMPLISEVKEIEDESIKYKYYAASTYIIANVLNLVKNYTSFKTKKSELKENITRQICLASEKSYDFISSYQKILEYKNNLNKEIESLENVVQLKNQGVKSQDEYYEALYKMYDNLLNFSELKERLFESYILIKKSIKLTELRIKDL